MLTQRARCTGVGRAGCGAAGVSRRAQFAGRIGAAGGLRGAVRAAGRPRGGADPAQTAYGWRCPARPFEARPRPLHPFVATRRVGLYWAGQEQRSGLLSTRKVLPSCLTLNHSCHGALGPWLVRLMMSSHAFSMHFRAFWRRHGCDGAARTALLRMGVLGRTTQGGPGHGCRFGGPASASAALSGTEVSFVFWSGYV